MAYILDANLTDANVAFYITRAGFTDVTAQEMPDMVGTGYYVIRDLNGNLNYIPTRSSVRDFCIQQYVIQQNS